MIIGLTGLYQAGKDTVAEILIRKYGFVRFAFADELKSMASKYYDWDGTKTQEQRMKLIELGRKAREMDPLYWVKIVDTKMNLLHFSKGTEKYVITDIRFNNESNWLKNNNGKLWIVERSIERDPKIMATDSEQFAQKEAYGFADLVVKNEGSMEDLEKVVDIAMMSYKVGEKDDKLYITPIEKGYGSDRTYP